MKKQYTVEKFIELVTLPKNKMMVKLVFAGHNKMELNDKSEKELRQMLLDYVTVNQEEFFSYFTSGSEELQNAIVLIGLPVEELFNRLGFDMEKVNIEEPKLVDEQEQYLYHTEELFEIAKSELINSNSASKERVLTYMSRIKDIEDKFRKYAVQVNGFVGSERYMQVYEYLKTLPRISPFIKDKTKGDGINMIMEKRYYDDIVEKLESFFSKSDIPKR